LYAIHRTLLGAEHDMPKAWAGGFTFREAGLSCGLRQPEGGPCGVLAAVQAFVVRALLQRQGGGPVGEASKEEAGAALVDALAHIIWQARVGRLACVVACTGGRLLPVREAAGALEQIQCSSADDVGLAVKSCIGVLMRPDGPGVVLLLYSLMLTRGLAMVQRDADWPTPLIGANGYCQQASSSSSTARQRILPAGKPSQPAHCYCYCQPLLLPAANRPPRCCPACRRPACRRPARS
jgi:hypothetical protein